MIARFVFILFLAELLSCETIIAQKAKTHVLTGDEAKMVNKDAATMYASEDYRGALTAYLDLYNSDPRNVDYNYRLAFCYLMTTVNKKAALKHLEYALQSKESKKDWLYYLGLAYMYNEKWDEAINALKDFKESVKPKPTKDFVTPDRLIENCNNGKELCAKPVNCTFTNLGKNVNSPFEEYNPFISADGRTLIFTSRRKGNMGGFIEDLGIYTADIFSAMWKDTIWSKARSIGANVNTEWDEESVGMTTSGDQIFIYFDNAEAFADIGVASIKGKMWQRPLMLPEQVNTKVEETGGCMSPDGNVIYFSSNRKDGSGGSDIWMTKKENGGWGNAVNLGSTINTSYDEINPYLSTDGKKLFFSSKGWNSMGGYDIFYSQWNERDGSWTSPVNIGFPLNDAQDNEFISFTGDERFAYIAAVRPQGLGDLDIYKVEFLDTVHHSFKTTVSGSVPGRIELTKVVLENKKTGTIAEYHPGMNNQFAFSATPGEYTLRIEGYNVAPYSEDITVGNDFPPAEIIKVVQLQSTK